MTKRDKIEMALLGVVLLGLTAYGVSRQGWMWAVAVYGGCAIGSVLIAGIKHIGRRFDS